MSQAVVQEEKKDQQQQLQTPYQHPYYPYPYYPYYNMTQATSYPNSPNPPNQNTNGNGNGKKKVFRLSWALLMAFLIAGVFSLAFAIGGYYIGIAYQSMVGVGASNLMLSSQVMNHMNYSQVGYSLQALGSQQLNVAMSLPTQFMYDGAMIGALIGFLLGLYYEHKQKSKPTHIE